MQTIIRVEKLSKTFQQNRALNAVDLHIAAGEMVALLGPSGSGKSTLLRHLSGLITGDKTPGSHIELLGRTVQREGRLARDIRKSRAHTGCIFQQFNLVNRLTVLENVLIGALGSTPLWRTCFRWFTRQQKQRAFQALTRVGMAHFAYQRVSTLSGGQQQRVAIARALMQQAQVILADEPIASLDPESARIVMDTLRDINQTDGITVSSRYIKWTTPCATANGLSRCGRETSFTTAAASTLITIDLTIFTAALIASNRTRRLLNVPLVRNGNAL